MISPARQALTARLLVGLALLLVPLAVGNLVRKTGHTAPTDGIRWEQTGRGLEVLQAPQELELARGDLLVAVSGVPVLDRLGLALMLERSRPGELLDYVFSSSEGNFERQVALRRSPAALTYVYLFMVGLASLGLGLAALRRRPLQSERLLLAATGLALFALLCFSPTGLMDRPDKLFLMLDEAGRLALAPLLVLLALALPPAGLRVRRRWLWLPSLTLAGLDLVYHLAGVSLPPRLAVALGRGLDRAGLVLLGVAALAALVLALLKLGRSQREGRASAVLLGGLAAGLGPLGLLYALPRAVGIDWLDELGRFSVLCLVALPASWAYVLLGLGPGDLRVLARRTLSWTLALVGSGVVYVGASRLGGLALGAQQVATEALLGLAALALALLAFLPLRQYSEALVAAAFHRGQRRDQELVRRFGRSLTEEIRLGELLELLLDRVESVVPSPRLALYLRGTEEGCYALARVRGELLESPPRELHFRSPELLAAAQDGVVTLDGAGRRLGLGDGDGLTHAFPLVGRGRLSGVLALSEPASGLSFEDVELLRDLAGYAAVAIENAMLYAEVHRKVEEVRALELFRHDVIESLSVGVLITDLQGVILAANPAVARLLASDSGELRGQLLADVLPEPLARYASDSGRELREPALFKLKQGVAERVLSVATTPLRRAGEGYGQILTLEDVTERIYTQSRSLQQDKLASLGLLAAGVAHEINTPLAGIASYTQLLLDRMPSGSHVGTLKKIEAQVFRAARIVQGLLNFSRKSERDGLRALDLRRVVLDTLGLLEHEVRKSGVRLVLGGDDELPAVTGEEGAVQQVIVNLVKNALDAMPAGGELRINLSSAADTVELEVRDEGHGMAPEVRERIFDPFFTTKQRGHGVGLGLSVVYGLVSEGGGSIHVDTAPGRGTSFRVRWPVSVSRVRSAAEASQRVAS